MFGYQYLILYLFSWLVFISPQVESEHNAIPQTSFELVITGSNEQSPAIIELGSNLNQMIDTSQTIKLPFAKHFSKPLEAHAISYEPKLLYLQIGNAIDLELTTTSIIYPFHCFT